MNVIHITTSLGNGGAESAMYRLIKSNEENTHTVISLTGHGIYADLLSDLGVEVHLLDFKGKILPISMFQKLRILLRNENPDIVQTWMYHANLVGGLAARTAGIKSVFWGLRSSNSKFNKVGKRTQLINRLCGILGNVVPLNIISCAYRATEDHIKIGYPKDKITTICNGYDFTVLKYDLNARLELRAKLGIGHQEVLLGTVARWNPNKDHSTLFRAFKIVSCNVDASWKLILAGPNMNTSNAQLVRAIAAFDLSESCIFLDQQNDIQELMSALDIHVLSSTNEGFPNVIAEAMACGTPCVSTDAGDAAHIIGNCGWISPIGEQEILANNIINAIDQYTHNQGWDAKVESAVLRIQSKFSIEDMSAKYSDAWAMNLTRDQ